jgi:Gpi18-like mannosyltransferase
MSQSLSFRALALHPAPPLLSNTQLVQVYLSLAIIANFACLFFNGYPADLGYWHHWINQLSTRGYLSFDANYPPMYIHWIYMVSKLMPALGAAIENNMLFKFLLEIPSLLCHLAVIAMVNTILNKSNVSRNQRHCVLALTALNPAILFNGPIWGQVDLIPVTFALAALLAHFSLRLKVLCVPLYMLAVLTKFQMICFAPVMGILFFRQIKIHLIGVLLGGVVFAAAFAPFIYHQQFAQYFKQAYINTLGEYAYTTLNAANLWMIITGNVAPDSYVMLRLYEGTPYRVTVNAKHFGMGLFALISLVVFVRGLAEQIGKRRGAPTEEASNILFYALICSAAFFTLLPAMHERYLFPAVIAGLAYGASNPQRLVYAVLITLVCFANMVLINGINGSDIWLGLSSIMVFTLCFAMVEFFAGRPLYIFLRDILLRLARLRWLGLWVLLGGGWAMTSILANHYRILEAELADNQRLLTEMPISSAYQTHGSLQVDKSFDGKTLSIGNQRYANGLGTHTLSNISYELPEGATRFSFMVGVDDEVGSADMEFSVWADGKLLWKSEVYHGFETDDEPAQLDITGVKQLLLRVEPVTDMQFDHADWINPIISFDHPVDEKPAEK